MLSDQYLKKIKSACNENEVWFYFSDLKSEIDKETLQISKKLRFIQKKKEREIKDFETLQDQSDKLHYRRASLNRDFHQGLEIAEQRIAELNSSPALIAQMEWTA